MEFRTHQKKHKKNNTLSRVYCPETESTVRYGTNYVSVPLYILLVFLSGFHVLLRYLRYPGTVPVHINNCFHKAF